MDITTPVRVDVALRWEPFEPKDEPLRDVQQAMELAQMLPEGKARTGLLEAAARHWVMSKTVVAYMTSETAS